MSTDKHAPASGTDNSLRARCPACSQLIGYAPQKVGMQVDCPKCKTPFLLPAAPTSSAPPQKAPGELIVSKPVPSRQPDHYDPLGLGHNDTWAAQPAQNGYAQNGYAQNGSSGGSYTAQPHQPMHNPYAPPQMYHPAATIDQYGLPYKSKVTAGLLGLFLGAYGAHNFYLGRTGIAVTQLLLTIFGIATSCIFIGILPLAAVGIWAMIESIMILTGAINDSRGRPLV